MPFLPGMPQPNVKPAAYVRPPAQLGLFPPVATPDERAWYADQWKDPDKRPTDTQLAAAGAQRPRYVEVYFKSPPYPNLDHLLGSAEDPWYVHGEQEWYGVVDDRHVDDYRSSVMHRWPGTVCTLIRSVK